MAKLVWPVRVSEELGERIDAAAAEAGLRRSAWMVRALESALGCAGDGDVAGTPALAPRDRVPSRVSVAGVVDLVDPANASIRSQLGVSTHRADAMARQRKLNAGKEKRA